MLFRIAFYNLRPDADVPAFAEFERRIAADYAEGCRTFGAHSLGTYRVNASGTWRFGYCDVYAVEGNDPRHAAARVEAAPDPPGFVDIIEECRTFMTSQEDRLNLWLIPNLESGISLPIELGTRTIEVQLSTGAPVDEDATLSNDGQLGRFEVEGLTGIDGAHIRVIDSLRGDPTVCPGATQCLWLRPVTEGAAAIPVLP